MPGTVGVAFDGMVPLPAVLDLARRAEALGVPSLWVAEHMGYRDALTSSMALLGATATPMVVPTAVSVYARHPMITAMTAATLEEAAPGRTALVLASGNPRALAEMGLAVTGALATMREYVQALRGLWAGGPVTLDGRAVRLRGSRFHVPARPVPVYIAAMGARMLELAGEIGDGVVLSGALSPAAIRRSLERVAAGARQAGRDPKAVAAAGFVITSVGPDGDAARREAKKMLAYLVRNRFVAEHLAREGSRMDRQAVAEAAARGDWETALRLVPDEDAGRLAVAGSFDECRRQLEAFRQAGLAAPALLAIGPPESRRLAVELAGAA